ncbi:MAG: ABC transporter ATP-binding protein [Pseudomonadota bacterium]
MREVVRVEDLVVRYGRRAAVDGVSLRVLPGEVYALLGRNGAGKSSLVRALIGLQRPTAGRVRVLGEDPWTRGAAVLPRVGVLAEQDDAPLDLPIAEIARFLARVRPRWDAAGFAARLAAWGIEAARPLGRLSRGQRRLVHLAMALGHAPELLVLDDPTLGLDAVARRAVFDEVVGALAEGGTSVLLTTHDLAGIEGLADRVGILDRGRLLLDAARDDLRARFRRLDLCLAPGAEPAALLAALAPLEPLGHARLGQRLEVTVAAFEAERWRALVPALGLASPPEEPAALSLEDLFVALRGGAP